MNAVLALQGIASTHIQCFFTDHNFRNSLLQTTRRKIGFKYAAEPFKYSPEIFKHLVKPTDGRLNRKPKGGLGALKALQHVSGFVITQSMLSYLATVGESF